MPDETNEESVARYYDTAIFEAELVRLTQDCPVERAITLRWLERLAPARAKGAGIGVGGGIYSEYLARKGCRLRLVDVSARLLDAAAARLRGARLGESIAGISRESATRLDSSAGGAAAGGGRSGPHPEAGWSAVRRGDQPAVIPARRQPGSGARAAHRLCAPFAVRRVSRSVCGRVRRVAADGGGVLQHVVAGRAKRSTARGGRGVAGPGLIERTGQTAEGLGVSDHFLYVGRKAAAGLKPHAG